MQKTLHNDVTIWKARLYPEKRLQTEYLNKVDAYRSILMFVAADSADTSKSRLWKPSRGPGRRVRILHSSVILLKLGNKKWKLWMLVPPSKLLVSADRWQRPNWIYVGGCLKPGQTLSGITCLMGIYCYILSSKIRPGSVGALAFIYLLILTNQHHQMCQRCDEKWSTEAICQDNFRCHSIYNWGEIIWGSIE